MVGFAEIPGDLSAARVCCPRLVREYWPFIQPVDVIPGLHRAEAPRIWNMERQEVVLDFVYSPGKGVLQ